MATRGSMPNAAAVSALHAAMDARSLLVGLTFTAQSPYTITCAPQQPHQQQRSKQYRRAQTASLRGWVRATSCAHVQAAVAGAHALHSHCC